MSGSALFACIASFMSAWIIAGLIVNEIEQTADKICRAIRERKENK